MNFGSELPLISIAVCTYNGETYLREQLDSLVNQDYPNLEIIIGDDCSSDNTFGIVNEYSRRFHFIKTYQNQANLGYVKNFGKAITSCSGRYIALSDQDDIWELNKISVLYENIKDHILVYHDSKIIDERGQPLNKMLSDMVNFYEGDDFRPFIFRNCISGHSMMFDSCLVKSILPFNDTFFHDWWIAYIAINQGSIGLVKEGLVSYRQHFGSETDILRKQGRKRSHLKDANLMFKQVAQCKKQTCADNYAFIENLHLLMKERMRSGVMHLKLLAFLINNMGGLFFIYKKNLFSKLNIIRKI